MLWYSSAFPVSLSTSDRSALQTFYQQSFVRELLTQHWGDVDKTHLSVEQVFGEMYYSCPAGPDEQEAGCLKKKKTHPLTANDFIFSPTCEEHAVTSVFFFLFN